MKRIFMRAVWGIYDNSHRILKRRRKIDADMNKVLKNKYNDKFVTYVFGEDNYKRSVDMGFDCVLIDKDPAPFRLLKEQYRHKLEAIKYAFEEDGYDEMIHFDWDCLPQKKMSQDFWKVLGKKEAFQANLIMYHRRKATWRKEDMRKIPNGGFVYIRDKTIPAKLIEIWETMKSPSCEPTMAKFTDRYIGGWQGIEKYWELFEPDFCNLHKSSPFSKEQLKSKNQCFIHYQG